MLNKLPYKKYNTQSDKKSLKKCLRQTLQDSKHQNDEKQNKKDYDIQSANNSLYRQDNDQKNNINESEDYLLEYDYNTVSQPNKLQIFNEQFNTSSQELHFQYRTYHSKNNNQIENDIFNISQQTYSQKVKTLMKGLKELIKELCLTKNSHNQVEEDLKKLIVEFQDSSKPLQSKIFQRSTNNPRQLSCLSEIRVRTIYQIQEPSFNTLTENEPFEEGLRLFHPFLSGTQFQSEESQKQTRLSAIEQEIFTEFMQKYTRLLQKQINRISRYNGQKKLKYLLSTVMKQIFTQIMRFTYQTKMSMTKKQTKNILNNDQLKTNLFVSTIQRLLNTKAFISEGFNMIKRSIRIQQKADIKLINKFQSKINYLDNLVKFTNRTSLREKFLKWRTNSSIIKENQKMHVLKGIDCFVKEILYEFALNENNLQKWKFIVWGKLNSFIKSICYGGECVLFPVDQELLKNSNDKLASSAITSNYEYSSRITSNGHKHHNSSVLIYEQSGQDLTPLSSSKSPQTSSPQGTFRFSQCSPLNNQQSQQDHQNYLTQKRLLDEVHENFSLQEIKQCLQHGQIIMHDIDAFKLILIPLKAVGGIIVVKYQIGLNNQKNNQQVYLKKQQQKRPAFMSVCAFYNILNALQLSQPVILQLMGLKQKFQYFSSRIEQKSHHKLILNHLLSVDSKNLRQLQRKSGNQDEQKNYKYLNDQKTNNDGTISQFVSVVEESNQQNSNEIQKNQSKKAELSMKNRQEIQILLSKMGVKKVILYHKNDKQINKCIDFETPSTNQLQQTSQRHTLIVSKDIVEAIFTELQKINRQNIESNFFTHQQQPKCLYLKKASMSFYACPILEDNKVIGVVQMHLDKDFYQTTKNSIVNNSNQSSFIVKAVDSHSEILHETVTFVTDAIVPMMMINNRCGKQTFSGKNLLNQCKVCFENYLPQKMEITETEFQLNKKQKQTKDTNGVVTILDQNVNKLFLNCLKALIDKKTQSSQKKLYEIQKIFTKQLQSKHKELLALQNVPNNYESQFNLINQQFFTKIFYFSNSRTKDNRIFPLTKKQQKIQDIDGFYHTNVPLSDKEKPIKQEIKLPFIDTLKLFNQNINNSSQFQPQTIEISLSKLNQIYKFMLRKMKLVDKKHKNTEYQAQEAQNEFQLFIEEILKSTLLKPEIILLQEDKKYHALQLWLYQLQHMCKRHRNDKLAFGVSVFPVFSNLDDKYRYLSAISCTGGVILRNESRKSEQKDTFQNQTVSDMNEYVFKLSRQLLGRIIAVETQNKLTIRQMSNNRKQFEEIQQDENKELFKNILTLLKNQKQLDKAQQTKQNLFNKTQSQINKIISSLLHIQSELKLSLKIKARKVIQQKFFSLHKNKNYQILQNLTKIIQNKIISPQLSTKSQIFAYFIHKITKINLKKSEHYLLNIVLFEQKMSNVFIRNKMLNTALRNIKNLNYQNQNQTINKLFGDRLKITKKFALQRIEKIFTNKIYNESSENSFLSHFFNQLKDFSMFKGQIRHYNKHKAIIKLQRTLQKLVCEKNYIPYFRNLSFLEKSLYESISLIGAQIKTINFHSINQFLTFVNERISIIINSEKRLIQILYGQTVEKVKVKIIIEDLIAQKYESLSVFSRQFDNQMYLESVSQSIKQASISMVDLKKRKFYIHVELIQNQTGQNTSFKDIRNSIQKVFKDHVSEVFKNFVSFYEKKVETFMMKVSKFMKIPVHFSQRKIEMNVNQDLQLKKNGFKNLVQILVKNERAKKIAILENEVEQKSKQLAKFNQFYQKRAKKLTLTQINQEKSKASFNETINDENLQNIISKKSLRTLRKNIENMDMSSENLSIQYQIKSKTVAGYQMMQIINTRERKQAMKQVFLNLSMIINEESATNLLSTNTFFLSSMRQPIPWSVTSRKLQQPIVDDVILEEKERLNYLKSFHIEQKNHYQNKFKKTGIKSIAKILNKMCKANFSNTVSKINSYTTNNPVKLLR